MRLLPEQQSTLKTVAPEEDPTTSGILGQREHSLGRQHEKRNFMRQHFSRANSVLAKGLIVPSAAESGIEIQHGERPVPVQDKLGNVPSGDTKTEVTAQ